VNSGYWLFVVSLAVNIFLAVRLSDNNAENYVLEQSLQDAISDRDDGLRVSDSLRGVNFIQYTKYSQQIDSIKQVRPRIIKKYELIYKDISENSDSTKFIVPSTTYQLFTSNRSVKLERN